MIPISGETSQGYDVIQEGVYAVSVTQNGCTDTSACVPMSLQSVTSLIDNTSIRLYPNPTDRLFHLDLGQIYSNVTLKITDIQGRAVPTSLPALPAAGTAEVWQAWRSNGRNIRVNSWLK